VSYIFYSFTKELANGNFDVVYAGEVYGDENNNRLNENVSDNRQNVSDNRQNENINQRGEYQPPQQQNPNNDLEVNRN